MSSSGRRIILVDPCDPSREMAARRLRAQGYTVDDTADVVTGADMALCSPPAAVVADLWMPSISGVQLCRLLRAEPATADTGVILCGDTDEPRNRFWADRAGANAYVLKRRTGDLVRALARAVSTANGRDSFFFQLAGGTVDIRDRLARHLDGALYDSVIAGEVRALGGCGSFDGLFDRFAQLLSQMTRYRWVALSTADAGRLALHHYSHAGREAEEEARAALGLPSTGPALHVEDEDAAAGPPAAAPIVRTIRFANVEVGKLAMSPSAGGDEEADATLVSLVARELGGPLRMTALIEESQRLASVDSLTGLTNRRAFVAQLETELARTHRHGYPLSLLLLDIDHFKQINDRQGHGMGDRVLSSLGALLREPLLRRTDVAARWGGEEFVVALPSTADEGALTAAERIRAGIEAMIVTNDGGVRIPVTASIGVAIARPGETLESFVERADRAMYASKTGGRNRVTVAEADKRPGRDPARDQGAPRAVAVSLGPAA